MFCEKCGTKKVNGYCPNCDAVPAAVQPQPQKSSSAPIIIVVAILIFVFLVVGGILLISGYIVTKNVMEVVENAEELSEEDLNRYMNDYMDNKYGTTTSDVKQAIVGEWDWGTRGYFVFDANNNVYLFKDSSKSMSNVRYGTYTISKGIKKNDGTTADGYYVVADYTTTIVDGVSDPTLNGPQEYAFVPTSNGNFTVTNINSYWNTGEAKRMK